MPLTFQETQGDLFSAPSITSLAHCVSRDMHMGKGIAIQFRKRFDRVNELQRQSALHFEDSDSLDPVHLDA